MNIQGHCKSLITVMSHLIITIQQIRYYPLLGISFLTITLK